MNLSSPLELFDMNREPRVARRRLIETVFAVTAGGGLQLLASVDALAAEPKPGPQTAAGTPSVSQQSSKESPMQDAIKACLDCHSMCLRMAMGYCLERGGRHVEQKHLRLMLNCAELCQTSANFMLSDSPLHGRVCLICAEACEACAKSCEQVGDMRECVEECQRCAKSCRTMT
ncbi:MULTISPECIES: four-helix bundle copper-binding protein [unclassified Variovorax]|uniref:four-helix bundle copper-binding protein n=1 Tax=unclassified Variovorax TaxID=663243 RepID=UPI00076C6838|nr:MULTISPECIES: four-helix bundle copper-binding protein [unclassified Variovorax]KWT91631.1 Ferredoxin [Variovorax sp. WDL1]